VEYVTGSEVHCETNNTPANAAIECFESTFTYEVSWDQTYPDDLRTLTADTEVKVRRSVSLACSGDPKGTVILSTGGGGSQFYYQRGNPSHTETIQALVDACLVVFEVAFTNDQSGTDPSNTGILLGHAGMGYRRPMYAYAKVVREILNDSDLMIPTSSGKVCAQGNSAASAMIGYGLSAYDLDQELDVAVMTAGPRFMDSLRLCDQMTADANPVIVDWSYDNPVWGPIHQLVCDNPRIDYPGGAMRWDDQMGLDADHCFDGDLGVAPNSDDLNFAKADGIISYGPNAEYRKLVFDGTDVYTLYGADEQKNNDAGAAIWNDCYPGTYEEAVLLDVNTDPTDFSGEHAFDSVPEGADAILEILLNECGSQ